MEILTWLTGSMHTLATTLHQFPVLQLFTDIFLKSLFVLSAFWLLDRGLGRRISSASRHLLWLNALACLAILPWLPAVFTLFPGNSGPGQGAGPLTLIELTVLPGAEAATGRSGLAYALLCLFLLPATLMLSRLFFSLLKCRRIRLRAGPIEDPATLRLFVSLKQELLLSRDITLRLHDTLESPVSFGLFKPTIILPAQSREWHTATMTDVLLHELFHIKRLDWLTTIFAYLVACVYWMNPLVRLALKRLRDESEHSCDTAVLNAGRSQADYADSLLGVATRCIHARRTPPDNHPLMQTMLDQNTLITRISRVLEENTMQTSELKNEIKRTALLLLAASAGMLSLLSATQVFSSQEQAVREAVQPPETRRANGEMLPLYTEEPVYPRAAAEGGIEGWVHLRFTVNADGSVPASSISVVEAEPADVFNNSAVDAAAKFRFSPRVVEGDAVAVQNVQYVFRFRMTEESASEAAITTPD